MHSVKKFILYTLIVGLAIGLIVASIYLVVNAPKLLIDVPTADLTTKELAELQNEARKTMTQTVGGICSAKYKNPKTFIGVTSAKPCFLIKAKNSEQPKESERRKVGYGP